MRHLIYRIAFFSLFFSVFLFNGCSDNQLAPVVNAWYRSNGNSNIYIVRKNDTIYSIAWTFGLDYRALADANHLTPPYALSPGQRLTMTTIPAQHAINPVLMRTSTATISKKTVIAETIKSAPTAKTARHISFSSHWQRPTRGRVIQGFSRDPSGHPGVMFAGKLGSPVHAAASGTVVYSGDGVRGYGNLIIIKHNDSYLSAYAFNERNLVSVGEHIQAGSVIARMGQNDAGRTLLYFEIRRDGVPVNPLRYLG